MKHLILCGLAMLLLTAGCRKPKPSVEYLQARGQYDVLVAKEGDDAYFLPEMTAIEGLLKQVPADSLDYAAAQGLEKEIVAKRTEVQDERDRRAKELEEANKPAVFANDSRPAVPQAPTEPVAGSDPKNAMPKVGMSVGDFERQFGGCFSPGPQITLSETQEKVGTYVMKDITNCRERHPTMVESMVVIKDNKVLSNSSRKEMKKRTFLPDGGVLIEDM